MDPQFLFDLSVTIVIYIEDLMQIKEMKIVRKGLISRVFRFDLKCQLILMISSVFRFDLKCQ